MNPAVPDINELSMCTREYWTRWYYVSLREIDSEKGEGGGEATRWIYGRASVKCSSVWWFLALLYQYLIESRARQDGRRILRPYMCIGLLEEDKMVFRIGFYLYRDFFNNDCSKLKIHGFYISFFPKRLQCRNLSGDFLVEKIFTDRRGK